MGVVTGIPSSSSSAQLVHILARGRRRHRAAACHVRPTGAYEVLSLPDPVVPIARRLGAAPLRPFRRYARLGSPTLSIPASPRRSGSRSLHLDRSQIVDDL